MIFLKKKLKVKRKPIMGIKRNKKLISKKPIKKINFEN